MIMLLLLIASKVFFTFFSIHLGINEQKPPIPVHQPSPPKDPSSPPPVNILVQQRQSTTGGSQFIVQDADSNKPAIGIVCSFYHNNDGVIS